MAFGSKVVDVAALPAFVPVLVEPPLVEPLDDEPVPELLDEPVEAVVVVGFFDPPCALLLCDGPLVLFAPPALDPDLAPDAPCVACPPPLGA